LSRSSLRTSWSLKLGRLRGVSYSEWLWREFRNGISHGFAVRRGGFLFDAAGAYFRVDRVDGREVLMVNPRRLHADFREGFRKYHSALRQAKPGDILLVNFLKTFDEIFIQRR
jgi:hypothetical protein